MLLLLFLDFVHILNLLYDCTHLLPCSKKRVLSRVNGSTTLNRKQRFAFPTGTAFSVVVYNRRCVSVVSVVILLMAAILHHLGCMKPYKQWDKLPINWCSISSINSSALPETKFSQSNWGPVTLKRCHVQVANLPKMSFTIL